MNPEIRDLWADALESNEYQQGKSHLTAIGPDGTETDCCLGVLCKLGVKAGVIPEGQIRAEIDQAVKVYGDEGAASMPPAEVEEWAGFDAHETKLNHAGLHRTADWFNDVTELTFPEIAKLIREQL